MYALGSECLDSDQSPPSFIAVTGQIGLCPCASMSLSAKIRIVYYPGGWLCGLKGVNTCEMLNECTMRLAILIPNIGHGTKSLLTYVTG